MPVTDPSATVAIVLSRAEQWVLHHVLLESLGLADGATRAGGDGDSTPAVDVIQKVEAGAFEFTPAELQFIRQVCGDHAERTQVTADRNLASAVADRIETTLMQKTVDAAG